MKLSLSFASATAMAAMSLPSGAALINLYTFNSGNANDSVGGRNGTVVNPANAVFSNGKLDLSANNGGGSANATDAFVDLPNGLFSDAIQSTTGGGVAGAASFSLWFSVSTNRNWAAALSFGSSNDGEGQSGSGSATDYIQLIPSAGTGANPLRLTTHRANVAGEGFLDTTTAALNVPINAVGVFNGTNFSFYVNGVQIGTPTAMPAGLDLSTFTNTNNWLGRSQWGDPVFDGSFDQLAIYNTALTASEVTTAYNAGPVAVPEASGAMLGLLGAASLISRRRRAV